MLYNRAVKSQVKAGVLYESRSKAQVSRSSAGLGGQEGEIPQSKIVREKKK